MSRDSGVARGYDFKLSFSLENIVTGLNVEHFSHDRALAAGTATMVGQSAYQTLAWMGMRTPYDDQLLPCQSKDTTISMLQGTAELRN